jgi:hypothetical protein
MNHRRLFSWSILLLVVFLSIFGYTRAKAQRDVVGYLEERLKQQDVPVISIEIVQELPVQLEITIQSMRDEDTGVSENPINLSILDREIFLAYQQGYFVERYTRISLNKQGEEVAKSETRVKLVDQLLLDTSPSRNTDAVTEDYANEMINLYGMTATNQAITSENGMQFLTLELSVPSIDDANQMLPAFMHSLRPSIENINAKGSHIVVCRVIIKDKEEKLLLNYILDLQLTSERWWMDENLTANWFSIPAPVP